MTPRIGMFVGAFAVLSLTFSTGSAARCMEGQTKTCTVGGKQGLMECISGMWTKCEVDTSVPPVEGTAKIAYKVVSIVYAVPGATENSVTYAEESSLGSSGATENTFKQGYGIETSASGTIAGWDVSASTGFTYSRLAQSADVNELKKVRAWSYMFPGPPKVGVNHDDDMIILLLGSQIQVKLYDDHAVWNFDKTYPGTLIAVYVGELRNPATMTAGTRDALDRAGVTSADYATILKADPFSDGNDTVDANRFLFWGPIFYRAPRSAGGKPSLAKGTFTQSLTNASSTSASNSYDVKVTTETGTSFADKWKAKLKVNGQWTWTDTAKNSSSTGQVDKADYSVWGPPYGYMGAETIDVYFDTLYRTYMFHLSAAPTTLAGTLSSRAGASVGSTEVVLLTNGTTYRTIADQDGNFIFNRPLRGRTQILVRAAGVRRTLSTTEIRQGRIDSLVLP